VESGVFSAPHPQCKNQGAVGAIRTGAFGIALLILTGSKSMGALSKGMKMYETMHKLYIFSKLVHETIHK
jgi:hypothetical protein